LPPIGSGIRKDRDHQPTAETWKKRDYVTVATVVETMIMPLLEDDSVQNLVTRVVDAEAKAAKLSDENAKLTDLATKLLQSNQDLYNHLLALIPLPDTTLH